MSDLMQKKWLEMIEAFLELTPQERAAEAEKRLDETLERMARIHNITPEEAYEKLIRNSHEVH
ncbi:MAG: hypothetical protein H8E17_03620 [Deltaproteobacteria bacterium]|nr:hypothetical protein [Deltaproteobacteria bacterium]